MSVCVYACVCPSLCMHVCVCVCVCVHAWDIDSFDILYQLITLNHELKKKSTSCVLYTTVTAWHVISVHHVTGI